jgi:hypothetical protein
MKRLTKVEKLNRMREQVRAMIDAEPDADFRMDLARVADAIRNGVEMIEARQRARGGI